MFKRVFLYVVLFICAIAVNSFSMTTLEQEKDIKKAFSILKETDIVSSRTVNINAAKSRNCWAFTKLFDSKNNVELFKELFKDSKYVSGKIYALIALHKLDFDSYQTLKQEIKETKIVMQNFCRKSNILAEKLFKIIESGDSYELYYFDKLPAYENTVATYDKNIPPEILQEIKLRLEKQRSLRQSKVKKEN